VTVYYYFNEPLHAYIYGVHNESNLPLNVSLDFSKSENMFFDNSSPVVNKLVEAHQLKVLMITQVKPNCKNYHRVCKLRYKALDAE
jgi:hypothetical protein